MPAAPIDWVPVLNTTNSTIPGGGLILSNGLDANGNVQGIQPTSEGQLCLVSDLASIPPGQIGQATYDNRVKLAYSTGASPPNPGETWGSQASSWLAIKGNAGFAIVGGAGKGIVNAVRTAFTPCLPQYRTDCLNGINQRFVSNDCGKTWQFESTQGCCTCGGVSGVPCCTTGPLSPGASGYPNSISLCATNLEGYWPITELQFYGGSGTIDSPYEWLGYSNWISLGGGWSAQIGFFFYCLMNSAAGDAGCYYIEGGVQVCYNGETVCECTGAGGIVGFGTVICPSPGVGPNFFTCSPLLIQFEVPPPSLCQQSPNNNPPLDCYQLSQMSGGLLPLNVGTLWQIKINGSGATCSPGSNIGICPSGAGGSPISGGSGRSCDGYSGAIAGSGTGSCPSASYESGALGGLTAASNSDCACLEVSFDLTYDGTNYDGSFISPCTGLTCNVVLNPANGNMTVTCGGITVGTCTSADVGCGLGEVSFGGIMNLVMGLPQSLCGPASTTATLDIGAELIQCTTSGGGSSGGAGSSGIHPSA